MPCRGVGRCGKSDADAPISAAMSCAPHTAQEMHFVDGRIARLAKRDSIYFDSGVGHLYVNGSDHRAEILVVCCDEPVREGALGTGCEGARP